MKAISIDDVTTKDRDDAFWVTPLDEGWQIDVFISDVALRVPRGSEFDVATTKAVAVRDEEGNKTEDTEERTFPGAWDKVETRYYSGGRTSPMLPRFLSGDKLSLVPGQKRATMRIKMTLDADLELVEPPTIEPQTIRNRAALAYPEIPAILADPTHQWHEQIKLAHDLATRLLARRRTAGALVIYDLRTGWVTNEDGLLIRFGTREDTVGYIIVQECMILANAAVAWLCADAEIPVLWRNHRAKAHAPNRQEIQRQIDDAMGQPLGVIDTLQQRTAMFFERATYGPVLFGHYGLNLPAYMHTTSPIRRYADLVNWRQIKAWLAKEELPHTRKELEWLTTELPYTREELEAVGTHIMETQERRAQETSAYFRQRAYRDAEDNVLGQQYDVLTTKEFNRVVKLIVREQAADEPPLGFIEGVRRRLARGEASLLARTILLAETPNTEGWEPLKLTILGELVKTPHDAVSILVQATQVSGWDVGYRKVYRGGPPHSPVFAYTARVICGDTLRACRPTQARSSKKAQQRAAVAILACFSELEAVVPDDWLYKEPVEVATHKEVTASLPAIGVEDPISALQQYAAQTKVPLPTYTVRGTGPSHTPTFTCTCAFGDVDAASNGASKKEAKRLAAAATIEALHR